MQLRKFSARKMLQSSTEELIKRLSGAFILEFDDGDLTVNANEVILSSFAWDMHRLYPRTPILRRHCINVWNTGKCLTNKTFGNILNAISWDLYDEYGSEVDIDKRAWMINKFNNDAYNKMILLTDKDVGSLDILDFIQIMEHPSLKEHLDNPDPTPAGISACYGHIKNTLHKEPSLERNAAVRGVRTGVFKETQILQVIGPRGVVEDIDSTPFRNPIMRGFAKGFRLFHDSLIESRSASKSLYFNSELLRNAEYFARKLGITAMIIERVHPGDCGTTRYLPVRIRDADKGEENDGEKLRRSDLEVMNGKMYMDKEDGKLKVIRPDAKHLIGQLLNIRSPITCNHPDPHGICATCFGQIAESLQIETNIGHQCGASTTQKSSQNVLSTKHLDASSVIETILIHPDFRPWIKTNKKGDSYMLADQLKGRQTFMILTPASVPGLTDILDNDINKLGLTHVSEIEQIGIFMRDADGDTPINTIPVAIHRRRASLTYDALEYIRETGWTVDANNNYVVDMKNWDHSKELMILPLRNFNMSDHSDAIEKLIESKKENISNRDREDTPEAFVIELSDLINAKIDVNFAMTEIITLSCMVRSVANGDFRLPKASTTRGLGVTRVTIPNRSLGAAMAFEYHAETLYNPQSFFSEGRPSHTMDVFLMPRETLADQGSF